MAHFNLTAAPTFSKGATVGAYRQRQWAGPPPVAGDAPRAPLVSTATVEDTGFAAFLELEYETRYYIGAQVNGQWLWKSITTAPVPLGGGGVVGEQKPVTIMANFASFTAQPQVRTENGLTTVRFEGNAKSTKEVAASTPIFTIPVGYRPLRNTGFWGDINGSDVLMQIQASTGVVTALGVVPSGTVVTIPEGVTWSISEAAGGGGGGAGSGSGTVRSVNQVLPGETGDVEIPSVLSTRKALGAVTGNVTLNLAEGSVFTGSTTGAVALLKPTGFAATGGRRYFEVELTGNHAITFPFLTGWRYGGEPPQDLSGSSSVNNFMFFTDDGVNFFGVGTEGLPASVVKITGAINAGEVPVANGSGAYVGAPLPAGGGGASTAAVEALIRELAVQNGGNDPLTISGTMALGKILVGASPSALEVADLATLVHELSRLAQSTISTTGSTSLEANHFYRVTAIEPTLVMPAETPVGEGAHIVIENASNVPAKVKGRFTPGSATVTTILLGPGEVVTYTSDASATLWRPTAIYNAATVDNAAAAGGFVAQTCDLPSTLGKPTAKTLHICKIPVPTAINVHELFVNVYKTGTLTAAYVALYSSEGTRLCHTEDEHVAWETPGVKAMKVGAAEAPVPGGPGKFVWAVVLCVGSVMPELGAAGFMNGLVELKELNANLSASNVRNGEGRNTAGEIAAYSVLPLTFDPAKNRGKATNLPLFWIAAA